MKHIFHRWKTIAENDEWKAKQCSICGRVHWIDKWSDGYGNHHGGYQGKPRLPWEPEPKPPTGGSNIS